MTGHDEDIKKRLRNPTSLQSLRAMLMAKHSPAKPRLRLCATGCRAAGALQVRDALLDEITKRKLTGKVSIVETGCHGCCAKAPVLAVDPSGVFYTGVKPEDAAEIVEKTVLKGRTISRLLYRDEGTGRRYERQEDIPFFNKQTRIVTKNLGHIDPKSIGHYISVDGYSVAAEVLTAMTPEDVLEDIEAAQLRGRGGAGFPTFLKWRLAAAARGKPKYILCNGDEGNPGTFMDRALMEGDPHAVIEGMVIAGYAIGAREGYIYVRAEYPIAVEHLSLAIAEARSLGLLGINILGSPFDFDIHIRKGAGAFVCGEETALIASTEGKRGTPRTRPPFPVEKGLWGKPTSINNAETLASVPAILSFGAEKYARLGTKKNRGTKVFSLAGRARNTGLIEVPLGVSVRTLVNDIGGGVAGTGKMKAVQMGGPAGGCLPPKLFNLPVDYESLSEAGAPMGSGGVIVMDEKTCMVDMARYFMEFSANESCGKCVPCRVGTTRMLELLTKICRGQGTEADLSLLLETAVVLKDASFCGLGQAAANPFLSTVEHFRNEYDAHIKKKVCPAGVCDMKKADD